MHCTKDAAAVVGNGLLPASTEAIALQPGHWQLHAVTIGRRRVLLAMEAATRFVVLLWGIKKGHVDALRQQLAARLVQHVRDYDAQWAALSSLQLAKAVDAMQAACTALCLVAGGTSRSVQAHLNDVVASVRSLAQQYALPDTEEDRVYWDRRLNDTLRSTAGGRYFYPDLAWFSASLLRYAGADDALLAQVAARHRQQQQQRFAVLPLPDDDDELERLNELLQQAGDTAMSLPVLEGFFAALICAPNLVPPSRYMEVIWEGGPVFNDTAHASDTLQLMMAQWNRLAVQLREAKDGEWLDAWLIDDGDVPGSEWALGFVSGMNFWVDGWEACFATPDAEMLLVPVMLLVETRQDLHKGVTPKLNSEDLDDLVQAMLLQIPAIYRLLAPQRAGAAMPVLQPQRRDHPKVGRNDPCPCGSGKKYKQCCGKGGAVLH